MYVVSGIMVVSDYLLYLFDKLGNIMLEFYRMAFFFRRGAPCGMSILSLNLSGPHKNTTLYLICCDSMSFLTEVVVGCYVISYKDEISSDIQLCLPINLCINSLMAQETSEPSVIFVPSFHSCRAWNPLINAEADYVQFFPAFYCRS